jgi:hypothetical protein
MLELGGIAQTALVNQVGVWVRVEPKTKGAD